MASRKPSRTWESSNTTHFMDAMFSVGTSRPGAWVPSGWRHFDSGSGILEVWDGSTWQTLDFDGHTHVKADVTDLETITTTPTASAVPKADGSGLLDLDWLDLNGTSFPVSPEDGDPFYRTDHYESYHYDATSSLWVADSVHEIIGGDSSTLSASTYPRLYPVSPTARYSSTLGWEWNYDMRVVGMSVWSFGNSTAQVVVRDDGTTVTGAAVSLSASKFAQDETLFSNTIAAGSVISLYNDATGSLTTACLIRATLRRVET